LCQACDHRIKGFPFCQDCIVAGVDLLQRRAQDPNEAVMKRTSPVAATLLSFIVPGLGAAYNGQTAKALVHFAVFASFFQMATVTDGRVPFFPLGVVGTWLYAAVDAYRTAQLLRSGLRPGDAEDAIARRLYGNPLAWSLTLVTLGVVFLLHTLFGLQLPVRQFLPALLVGLGAYMLYDFIQKRREPKELGAAETQLPPTFASYGTIEAARLGGAGETTRLAARPAGVWPLEPRN
jgi:TM2 domain-containing membrane protein YozV